MSDNRHVELSQSPHLREQVARIMEPLRLIVGTKACPDFETVVRNVAFSVYALEKTPDCEITHDLVAVRRNPASGYDLLINAATVFEMQMRMEKV